MRRVLVTGGTGFLGSWTVAELAARGWAIRCLDLQSRPDNLDFVRPGLSAGCQLMAGDVRNAATIARHAKGCDAIIHLAGLMTVDCARDPALGATINVMGSVHMFEAARKAGIRRIAYASSAAVYGPEDSAHPRPMSFYGAWKLAVEGMARSYWLDYGLPSTGLRPWIVYGPGESSGVSAGPSIACRAAAEGREAEIKFSGRAGFVHITDVARAFAEAIEEEREGATAFDLGGDVADVFDFVELLKTVTPSAKTTVSGAALRIPPVLQGGDRAAWFDRLPVTGLASGIVQTLSHWSSRSAAA